MSHRSKNGERVRGRGKVARAELEESLAGGEARKVRHRKPNGGIQERIYKPPEVANPGNVVFCTVGGSRMGSNITHDNEAAFPEKLPDFFIRSFCAPGDTVLDPFGGSGTTAAVAIKNGRKFISIDVRESQVDLMRRRIKQAYSNRGFQL